MAVIDYQQFMNDRIQKVKPSGIRRFFDIANEMDHVISLSIGEPDFSTPWHVRQAGIESLEKGRTWYTPNRGFAELRQEICNYFQRRFHVSYDASSDVLVTVGGSEAIDLAIRTIIAPGDEVLIPQPCFVCYEPMVQMAQGVPVIIETKEENSFRLTPEELLSHISPKTKMLILPYPNNPTGGVMRRQDLEKVAEIVRERNLFVLSDEIYGELTYGGEPHVSFAEVQDMKERTVVISGFSKAYAMTGWRLGYALGPSPIIGQMTKLHQYAIMSAPTTAQYAAIEALKNGGEVVGNRTRAKVVKNKVAPPFREAEFDIMYGEGIAHTGELIDLGARLGIITKAGSWFSMGEVRIGQGRDAAKKYLEENPDIAADVEAQIRANFDKLMGNQSRIAAAKAAGKAVNVSADDFNDED